MPKAGSKGKLKTSVALDRDLLTWVDRMVQAKRFANRTHAIEYALQKLKEAGTDL
jgi:Arc/MetJ-type ribon-helix-helix transcriptional regulator